MKSWFSILLLLCVCIVGFCDSAFAQKRKRTKKEPYGLPLILRAKSNPNCTPKEGIALLKVSKTGEVLIGDNKIEKNKLVSELNDRFCGKLPWEMIVYVKPTPETNFSSIAELLKTVRTIDVDNVGFLSALIDDKEAVEKSLKAKIPYSASPKVKVKANPRALIVAIGGDGQIDLNKKTQTLESLTETLKTIFAERAKKKIYRTGSEEIEKTVFIQPLSMTKFADFSATIEAVLKAGANPVGISIDLLPQK